MRGKKRFSTRKIERLCKKKQRRREIERERKKKTKRGSLGK